MRPILSSLAALALAAACAPRGPGPAPPGRTAIRFATDWRAEAEQGGVYQALATGEYARRRLDVRIVQGGPGANVPELLGAGAADMGIGSNAFTVLNLASEGVPVKAVAAMFQRDPQVLIAHPGQGVTGLADLKGRPILLADAATTSFWPWLKARFGLQDAQVRKYAFSDGPFLANPRAVQEGYVTSEPYTIERASREAPVVMLLADAGYPGYGALILAPKALIARDKRAVQAFVDATAAGWTSYLHGDPRPGDALILRDNPQMRPDILAQARDKLRAYRIVEVPGVPVGGMTEARWSAFAAMAHGAGLARPGADLHAAYTLAFAPAPAGPGRPAP